MRLAVAFLFAILAPRAGGQLRPREAKALDDAMILANLRPGDLGNVPPPPDARIGQVEAMRDPIAAIGAVLSRDAAAATDELALLRASFGLLGTPAGAVAKGDIAEVPASVPAALRRPVGILVTAIAAANDEIRASLVRLSPTERRTLIETLPRLGVDDPSLSLDFARAAPADFTSVRRLLDRVDTARIENAGLALALSIRTTLPALQAVPKKAMATLVFRSRGVTVELSGAEADVHDRRDVGLLIDLGGDDRYTGRYGAGVGYASVLIDLAGNDRYFGPDANYGTGIAGIGLVYDLAGDDVYGVRSVGLGCGIAGVGLLDDEGGDDRYRVVGLGLGAGVRGVGLLLDRIGDDAYNAGRAGQGYGALAGVGWCVDDSGEDSYRGGEWVQGTGRDAGFGLLSDLAGSDSYQAASGQGAALSGFGVLQDDEGDDSYVASGRAQGFASQGGFAALIDGAGDDSYLLRRGPGQVAAFSAVAMLVDRGGNDVYGGTDGTPATAFGGGVAILVEAEGDDRYLASTAYRRNPDGISLWADGGGRDRYGDGRSDAQADAGVGSVAYDAYGAAEPALPSRTLPAPGSIPLPSSQDLTDLRRRATDGPDRDEAIARLVGIGVPALEALAADLDESFPTVASRIGAPASPVVARLASSKDARAVRLALAVAGSVTIPPEVLVAALERPDIAFDATIAAGRARDRTAVPDLIKLALGANGRQARAAIEALAVIADPQSAVVASGLVDSADPTVRRAALRLIVTEPSVAYGTGTRLLAASDGFRQRIGLSILGAIGTPQAFAAIAPALRASRDAKIGALLALSGQVPTDLIAAVVALRQDSDPLVRAVAERTEVEP